MGLFYLICRYGFYVCFCGVDRREGSKRWMGWEEGCGVWMVGECDLGL